MKDKTHPLLTDYELDQIAIHEVRVFDRHGRLKRITPAKTLREIMQKPMGVDLPESYFKVTYLPTSI